MQVGADRSRKDKLRLNRSMQKVREEEATQGKVGQGKPRKSKKRQGNVKVRPVSGLGPSGLWAGLPKCSAAGPDARLLRIYMCIHIYIYTYTHMYTYTYIVPYYTTI